MRIELRIRRIARRAIAVLSDTTGREKSGTNNERPTQMAHHPPVYARLTPTYDP